MQDYNKLFKLIKSKVSFIVFMKYKKPFSLFHCCRSKKHYRICRFFSTGLSVFFFVSINTCSVFTKTQCSSTFSEMDPTKFMHRNIVVKIFFNKIPATYTFFTSAVFRASVLPRHNNHFLVQQSLPLAIH